MPKHYKILQKVLSIIVILTLFMTTFIGLKGTAADTAEVNKSLIHDGVSAMTGMGISPGGGSDAKRTFKYSAHGSNNHIMYRFTNGLDLSGFDKLEFELELSTSAESYDLWKDNLKFIITVGGTLTGTPAGGPFHDGTNYTHPVPAKLNEGTNLVTVELGHIKELGVDLSNVTRMGIGSFDASFYWRTDGITLEGNTVLPPYNKSAYYSMGSGASESSNSVITEDMTLAIRNLYGISEQKEEGFFSSGGYGYIAKGATRLAANGSGSDAVAYDVFDTAVDISNNKYIEFDFFISDIEAFRNEKNKNSGYNPYSSIVVRLNTQGRMTNEGGDPRCNITGFHTSLAGYTMCDLVKLDDLTVEGDEYITESGWVHIKIPISSLTTATQTAAIKSLKSFAIGFTTPDYPNNFTQALTQNYAFGFKNLKVTGAMVSLTTHCIDTEGNPIVGISNIVSVVDKGSSFTEEIPVIPGYNIKGFKTELGADIQCGTTAYINNVSINTDIYYVYELNTDISDGKKIKFHDGTIAGTPSSITANTIGVGTIGDAADKVFDYQVEARQSWLNNIYLRLYEGVDLSGCNTLEFEFFLYSDEETYADWMPNLKFILTTGGTETNALKDGNHYSIPVPAKLKQGRNIINLDLGKAIAEGADLSNVTRLTLESFDGTLVQWEKDTVYIDRGACAQTASVETNLSFGLRNVYGKYVSPNYSKGSKLINAGANAYMSTKAEGLLWLRPVVSFDPISVSGTLEFDYFISDLETLTQLTDIETNEKIFTGIFAQINMEGGDIYDIPLYVEGASNNKITDSGWTHITIPIDGNIAWKNMSSFGVYVGDTSKSTFFETNFVQSFKNLAVTDYTKLENQIDGVLLNNGGYAYLNKGAVADTATAKFEIINAPLDGRDFYTIEFDMFVSDYKSLVANEEFNGFRARIDTQIIGVAKENLIYYYNYTNQIKQNGWNHIVIPFENTGSIRRDFLLYVQLQVTGTSAFKAPKSYIFTYKNIVGKGKPEYSGPVTEEQPSRPDSTALYITDCETLAGDGQWTPSNIEIDTYNKSEGKASVSTIFKNQPIRGNSMRFISQKDFSIKNNSVLKFDIYVSDVNILNAKSKIALRLYSDNRGTSDYAEWYLDINNLQSGWNSLAFAVNEANLSSDFDKSSVKGFYLLCTEANFTNDEEVKVYIDNIRITASTFAVENTYDEETDENFSDTNMDEKPENEITNSDDSSSDAKIKTVTKIKNVTKNDFTVATIIIIVLAGLVAVVIGFTVFVLIKKRKVK